MHLYLPHNHTSSYHSPSQKIRIVTENWVGQEIFCPSCGRDLEKYGHNQPVADFQCVHCCEDYELKGKKDRFGGKIVDGAYATMIERLKVIDIPTSSCSVMICQVFA